MSPSAASPRHLGAIDQGTTSTRFIVFDRAARPVAVAQKEHRQIYPKPGWVEHDPDEIWHNTEAVVADAMRHAALSPRDLAGIGITNQRETTIVWDRRTGKALENALVWQDTRVAEYLPEFTSGRGSEFYRQRTGLPLSSYFSSLKIKWILDHVRDARAKADAGDALFGNVDTFLTWHLTGGTRGGLHITDVTNASRTQLMNLATLDWDDDLLSAFGIPRVMLPQIRSSSELYGTAVPDAVREVPIAGILGDQQAALVGQSCFKPGEAKNTYGTGCFLLMNMGERQVSSSHGLLTTVAYRLGSQPACYALEGSIAVTGALVQWLRDNLALIAASPDVEALARTVSDNGGVYFVPAFSGLYAPYWKDDARGVVTGLTRYANRGHIARAVLEATAFQTWEVLQAMEQDSGVRLESLRVDGGMTENELLMQFQSDVLDRPVVRPAVTETTALGAAFAAGLATGVYSGVEELTATWQANRTWTPNLPPDARDRQLRLWKKAVTRSFEWVE
jgi:glycerol kinase